MSGCVDVWRCRAIATRELVMSKNSAPFAAALAIVFGLTAMGCASSALPGELPPNIGGPAPILIEGHGTEVPVVTVKPLAVERRTGFGLRRGLLVTRSR